MQSFVIHFGIYAVIMVFLCLIWAITGGGYFWPVWPAMGWGVGVAIHGIVASQVNAAHRRNPNPWPARTRPDEPLRPPVPRRPSSSKWISVMFTDIADSTRLTEALGDAEWSRLRSRHRDMLREQFAAHGGTEVSAQGDGFLARFGSPALAARCAIDIQRKLDAAREEHGFAPKVRIGIHAGEAVEEDDGDVVGRVVNLASRVMSAAEPEEILVTEPVADHLGSGFTLEDRGLRPLRGVPQPRHLLAVVWS
jgi:class 3 adenylate cyclase